MPADDNTQLLLGEIKGKLDMVITNQERHIEQLTKMGVRLGRAETASAKSGLITGAIAAVGISFIKEKLGL